MNTTEIDKTLNHHGADLAGCLRLPNADSLNADSVNGGSENGGSENGGSVKHVVLMISGSGEIDRNENGMQMQLNTFNSLADSLAEAGIASLRFDKRGCASSGGRYHDTGFFDFVDDASAWLSALDTYPELDGAKRFVMGHSEGALIAAFVSARNPGLTGQILLTPFVENVEHAIERQLQRTLDEVKKLTGFKGFIVRMFLFISGNQVGRQRKLMKRIKNTNKSSIKVRKALINAKWLREVTSVNPEEVYAKVKVPTLSIGGAKDIQCLPEDARQIASLVNAPVDVHVLSDLTHILRTDEEEPSTFRYKQLAEKPIDSRVPEHIIAWIKNTE